MIKILPNNKSDGDYLTVVNDLKIQKRIYSNILLFIYSNIFLFIYSNIFLFIYSNIFLFIYSNIFLIHIFKYFFSINLLLQY